MSLLLSRTQNAHPRAQLIKTMTQNELEAYDAMMADRDSWKERFLRLAKEKALRPLDAAACSGWVGKLIHDRSKHADWGWLRDEAGELIVIVKMPFMEEEELHEHRRNGTDPAQGRVDIILSALYGQNASRLASADPETPNP